MMPTTPDSRELRTFSQHISIAATLLGTSADLASERDPAFIQSAREAWRDAWEQIREARAIVARRGCDLSEVDAASVRARDPNLVAAGLIGVTQEMRTAARATIVALRRALPESDQFAQRDPQLEPSAYEVAALRPRRALNLSPIAIFRIARLLAVLLAALIYGLSR